MDERIYKKLPKDIKEERDLVFKIILVGDQGVGKTALANTLAFSDSNSPQTKNQNIEMLWANYEIEKVKICVQYWDIFADENFETMCSLFYKSASCIFLIFSVNDKKSFDNLTSKWMNNINNFVSEDALLILVGNKADLAENREVTPEEAEQFIYNNNFDNYFEVSANNNSQIDELIKYTIFNLFDMFNESQRVLVENESAQDERPYVSTASVVSINLRNSVTSIRKSLTSIPAEQYERKGGCCSC